MIAIQYVREAIRIRKRFEQLNKLLEKYESQISQLRTDVETLRDTTGSIRPGMFDVVKDKKLNEAITHLSRLESKIGEHIAPLEKEMDLLRKQSDALYDALKERYPQYDDMQLKTMLFAQIA